MLLLLVACAKQEPVATPECPTDDSQVWVISQLKFSRESETVEGESAGFNLDGDVTSDGGATGCGIADFVDPDGTQGIDNQFARVLPVLETTEAQALEALIQAAVDDGSLLITLEEENPEDPECLDFAMGRATGTPSLGTDGTIEWYQTLLPGDTALRSQADDVSTGDGRLVATGLTASLPLVVLGHELQVTVLDGSLRFDVADDGSVHGYLGGGLDREELMSIATTENIDSSVAELLESLLDYNVDLAPDDAGDCQQLSITLEFTGVPVFLFEG